MPDRKTFIRRLMGGVSARYGQVKEKVVKTLGLDGLMYVLIYHGYTNGQRAFLKGRALRDKRIKATAKDDIWANILNSYKRVESDPIPGALIELNFGEERIQVEANEDGFFQLEWDAKTLITEENLRLAIEGRIIKPVINLKKKGTGSIFYPPSGADFGVISDIDDTIIETGVSSLAKMARLTFLHNAYTRWTFPGLTSFYQSLKKGVSTSNSNPFFYVSSSPWNLYDMLCDFIEVNNIPAGPLLLRDFSFDSSKLAKSAHSNHKRREIKRILSYFPDLSFILIGDSGQRDAQVYAELARTHKDQILAIYIRDVGDEKTAKMVRLQMMKTRLWGVDMLLIKDFEEARIHAVKKGLI